MKPLEPEQKMGLLAAARVAAAAAYCPYSKFRVGASVLGEDGAMYTGCNIENDSFGLTICAERVAVFNAISSGTKRIVALAISFPDAPAGSPEEMTMPCGACRQVMAQFAGSDMLLLIDEVAELSLGDMLPKPFRLDRETCFPTGAPITVAKEPASDPER
jgi:cytidine deaminase